MCSPRIWAIAAIDAENVHSHDRGQEPKKVPPKNVRAAVVLGGRPHQAGDGPRSEVVVSEPVPVPDRHDSGAVPADRRAPSVRAPRGAPSANGRISGRTSRVGVVEMPDSGSRGSRGDPRPPFFDSFDSDPPDAKAAFVEFSTAFLTAHPPPSMKRLERYATRAGLIFELNERLCADNFKKLKTYKNIGSTFQSWLWVVAERWCADLLRAYEKNEPIILESELVRPDGNPAPLEDHPDSGTSADELAIRAQQIEKVKRCLAKMNPESRLLLQLWSEGWTAKELIVLVRSNLNNVQMGNRLHECRRRLRKLMLDAGLGGTQ